MGELDLFVCPLWDIGGGMAFRVLVNVLDVFQSLYMFLKSSLVLDFLTLSLFLASL